MKLAIIDYGMGNLNSVANAFEFIGVESRIITCPNDLYEAERIVLPGVGAFGDSMMNLQKAGFINVLEEVVLEGKTPFLGVCVGMQMLASVGHEHGEWNGLNWIPGKVVRLTPENGARVPHIGWNDVQLANQSPLLDGCKNGTAFYFLHSYHFVLDSPDVVTSTCEYGGETIIATIQHGNIYGVQFHPEKSHKDGLNLLKNFCRIS